MKKKKYIGQFISIKFTDRKTPVNGFVIDYNDEWTLMKHNPFDYEVDGYIILRHKNIKEYQRGIKEKWYEKVLVLKGLQPTKKEIIPLDNLETILKYLTSKYEVFEIYKKTESMLYLGKFKSINSKELIIDDLNPKGKWEGTLKIRPGDVRLILFDTDYINTLKLIAKKRKKSRF